MAEGRVHNFGAGPSALPIDVLQEATKGLLNFQETGIGIAEISHRSKEFTAFLSETEDQIRTLLQVPPTHKILFTQGGGSGQFSSVVLNLLARHHLLHPDLKNEDRVMDYVVTGSWSKKAMEEAKRLGGGRVNIAADARRYSQDGKSFDTVPPHDDYIFSADPALIYYCENETVDGVQFAGEAGLPTSFPFAKLPENTILPLVADYSSSFMSRPIPRLADHAVIFAGAQKNLGPAGLTILIVRQDCLVDVDAAAKLGAIPVPLMLSYKTLADSNSLYNTPPVLPVYIAGLVLRKMSAEGGLQTYAQSNRRKFEKIITALKEGEAKGAYKGKVKEGSVSWMNIVFDVPGEGRLQQFLDGAAQRGMKGLAGHRSVGGVRVSLYNAITEEETDQLVQYMNEFATKTS